MMSQKSNPPQKKKYALNKDSEVEMRSCEQWLVVEMEQAINQIHQRLDNIVYIE